MEKEINLTDNQSNEMRSSRDSFVFYRSFHNAIKHLSHKDQLTIYRSISVYALDRKEPDLKEKMTNVAWSLIKPQIDANWLKFENGCRGKEAGKLGGRPRKNPTGVILKTPNENVNVNVNKNENENENDNENDNENNNVNINENRDSRFEAPSIGDLEAYISANNLSVSAAIFFDYYASNGWMMGKNPMADWQAALRIWHRKNNEKNINENSNQQKAIYNDL